MKTKTLLIAILLIPSISFGYGYRTIGGNKDVTTAGTAVQLSTTDTDYFTLLLCAKEQNTGAVVVGGPDVVADQATRVGTYLNAGECRSYSGPKPDFNGNLQYHWIDSTVNGEGITYEYTKPFDQ